MNKPRLHVLSRQLNFQKGPNSINNSTGAENKAHSWGCNVGTSWGSFIMQLLRESFLNPLSFLCFFKSLTLHLREDGFEVFSPSKWYLLVPACCLWNICWVLLPKPILQTNALTFAPNFNPSGTADAHYLTAGTVRLASASEAFSDSFCTGARRVQQICLQSQMHNCYIYAVGRYWAFRKISKYWV